MGYTLRKRDGKWHAYFVDRAGRRFRKSTKQEDKRRAAIVADDWYRRLADPAYQAANATTIELAGRHLVEALKNAGRSPETIKFYGVKLSQIARILGADTALSKVTAVVVDEYIRLRKADGAKPYTISKELTALRMLLKHARRRGEFDRDVSQVMPVGFATGYKPKQVWLTEGQVWALMGELPPNVARYVAFVCATTARDSGVKRALSIHLSDEGVRVFDFKTKGSSRTVPLNHVTSPFALLAFWGLTEGAMVAPGISSVRHALDRAAKRLKLPHVSPNDLRRSVGHWLLARDVPRDIVAGIYGHANTKMLDAVYGKLNHRELGAAVARALGSSVDETWINQRNSSESVDQDGNVLSVKQLESGAQGRNRTADTGIFSPRRFAENPREKVGEGVLRVDETWKDGDETLRGDHIAVTVELEDGSSARVAVLHGDTRRTLNDRVASVAKAASRAAS